MFNFTTTLSYGLRFMANIASDDGQPKQLKRIAQEERISPFYLRKVVPRLEKGGVIKSLKGPGGGFVLARKPSQISVLELIHILSHDRIRHCLKIPSSCGRYDHCLVKGLWEEAYAKVNEVFKRKTLATIIKR